MVTERCCVCGEEHRKDDLVEVFTGRIRYICPRCRDLGDSQLTAKQTDWRSSSRGKAVIERCKKFK